jgi:hypothetical protein
MKKIGIWDDIADVDDCIFARTLRRRRGGGVPVASETGKARLT